MADQAGLPSGSGRSRLPGHPLPFHKPQSEMPLAAISRTRNPVEIGPEAPGYLDPSAQYAREDAAAVDARLRAAERAAVLAAEAARRAKALGGGQPSEAPWSRDESHLGTCRVWQAEALRDSLTRCS